MLVEMMLLILEGYTGTISNFLVELTERSDNAIEISGGQGENAGEFSLSNGKIDGMGKNATSVYSIDDKAKGKLINVFFTNTGDDAIAGLEPKYNGRGK